MVVLLGSQYILSNRIADQDSIYYQIHGANISYESTSYSHNLFSVIAETTYKKNLEIVQLFGIKLQKKFLYSEGKI